MRHDYAPSYYYVKARRSNKKNFGYLFGLLVLFIIIVFFIATSKPEQKKEVAGAAINTTEFTPTTTPKSISKLEEIVSESIKGAPGEYGIVILDLESDDYFVKNENKTFQSASLYKLWVMGTVMKQLKEKKIKENTILSADVDKLYEKFNLASPSAQETVKISVIDAVEKMITVSDNTTALLLSSKAQLSNVRKFLTEYGLSGSKLGTKDSEPITNAYDTALFFRKLYEGEIVDREYSEKMIDILKRQRLNSKIPKYLPDDVFAAHKTGELDGYSHDAGIIYTENGDYILAVLTKSKIKEREDAEEVISLISRDVYGYFTQKERN